MPDPALSVSEMEELRAIDARLPAGPWEVWSSNSFRRITGPDGKDGGVLSAYVQRPDGHPDLSMNEHQLADLCALRNALPRLLASSRSPEGGEVEHAEDCQSHIVDVRGVPDECTCGAGTGPAAAVEPIPMVLFCPRCGAQHIDAPESSLGPHFRDPGRHDEWTNPPHRSHLCHECGCIWRPADVPTVGVEAIATKGKADNFDPLATRSPVPSEEDVARTHDQIIMHLFGPFDRISDELDGKIFEAARAILALLPPGGGEAEKPCPVCGNEERGQGGYLSCECPAPPQPAEGGEG